MGSNDEAVTENENSLLDEYSNKVFRLVVLIVPFFFLCGNGTMTIMHCMGYYSTLNDVAMWVSNAIDIIYVIVAIYLVRTSYGPDGLLIPRKLPIAKMVLMVMVVVQWNLNSYICPFTDFWAYAPLFVIVEAFFFDARLVRTSTFLIVLSMVISWFVNGEHLLPARDEFFLINMAFRAVGLTFTLLCINIITLFGKVFIIEMVTSREKERKMKEKSAEYEREARMKSDFLANMSHEIRTPMNAVIGMAEIAMREDLPPTAIDCLTQIQKSGRSLLNIINDILDYSKIDSGKMEIIPERYEPVSELSDICNILATRLEDKNLELYSVADNNIPHALFGDAMRIRQVLINLANNAIKFTRRGSVGIVVECEYTDEDMVMMTFHIRDTGIGIKPEDMDKLFVNFQQVNSRRNRSVEGTGLGLAISKQLVEAMGGKIGVNSEYGKGSDFWFSIPQKVIDPAVKLVINDMEEKRAIIMDENQFRRSAFLRELDRLGIRTSSISGPEEYSTLPGITDYLFFDDDRYMDDVLNLMKTYPDLKGVAIIRFNSTYKSDNERITVLRRPILTQKVVRLLNDEEEEAVSYSDNAYEIDIIAPTAKILIVDDNAINITIAEGLLAPMQMIVDSAQSGKEAIAKIKKEHYDIVLMDHMMPEMDGVDTTKIIREEITGVDDLVIIALSANALKEAKDMFVAAGMNDFVAKPIEVKDLVAKIRKWLPEDKIQKNTNASAAGEKEKESNPLEGLHMLDTTAAVKSLGSPKLLRKIAEEYCKTGRKKLADIKAAYESEDIENYTIRVHALKSSSRQIGAFELGDMAETLEKAGNNKDIDLIKAETEKLLTRYDDLLRELENAFPVNEEPQGEKDALSDELLKEQLEKLKGACEDLDMDIMEEVRDELKKYGWPEDKSDDLTALCEAIDGMDAFTCEEIIEKLV